MQTPDSARDTWPRLMARAQGGDKQAYARLLTALVPVIRAQARRHIRDETAIEDVIQEVLLTVHRVRHTYDPDYPFMPWLTAIISTRCVDALRRRGRRQQWEIDQPTLAEETPAPDASGYDRQDELAGFLRQLPSRQRAIIEHVHLREMSLSEAAAHHNLSVAAVKSLLHRALTNLRKLGTKS